MADSKPRFKADWNIEESSVCMKTLKYFASESICPFEQLKEAIYAVGMTNSLFLRRMSENLYMLIFLSNKI